MTKIKSRNNHARNRANKKAPLLWHSLYTPQSFEFLHGYLSIKIFFQHSHERSPSSIRFQSMPAPQVCLFLLHLFQGEARRRLVPCRLTQSRTASPKGKMGLFRG